MAPTTTTQQLLLAATPITTDGNATNNGNGGQSPLLGFVTIIIACFLSGFAGIYFEKILKGSDVSVWLRNTQLAALSIPISLFVIAVKDGQQVNAKGFMQGFDIVVWAVVLLQALGGLVVAVVIKYADNILKAFATSVSIVVATVASIFIFAIYPRLLFIGGATLVIAAVVLYGTFPYKKKRRAPKGGDGDDEELVKGGGEELQVIVRKLSTAAEEEKEKKKAAQESANGTPPANSNGNGTLANDVEQKQRKQQQVTMTTTTAGPPPPREEVPPRQEPPSTAAAVLKKQTAVVVDDDKQ